MYFCNSLKEDVLPFYFTVLMLLLAFISIKDGIFQRC